MTEPQLFAELAQQLGISEHQIAATVALLDDGATIPFIARYRKEATGTLDEVQIAHIRDGITRLRERETRREYILKTIEEQGKLNDDLKKRINEAQNITELEDLYLPYKPKRKTRASVAKERGLEPLAQKLFDQEKFDVDAFAASFVDAGKDVADAQAALDGARDIIAEWVSENPDTRKNVRELFWREGVVTSKVMKGKETDGQKFKDYFEWNEPIAKTPSHRLLAMRRGEKEGILALDIFPPEEEAIAKMERQYVKHDNAAAEQVKLAIKDSYKRLLRPSLETEVRMESKMKADEEAIKVFASNLKELLLAPPVLLSALVIALVIAAGYLEVVASLTFVVLALSFVAFGIASLNLVTLLKANLALFLEHGSMAAMDGALGQLLDLLLSTVLSMVFYLVFKSCEYALVRRIGGY